MRMNTVFISILFISIVSRCNFQNLSSVSSGIPFSWIDAPLDGSRLPVAAYEIVAHSTDPSGISQIEITINGTVVTTIPGTGTLFTARYSWLPAAPGDYVIQSRGMNSHASWGKPAKVQVTVGGAISPTTDLTSTETPTPTGEATSTETPTLTPTITPTSTSSVPVFVVDENAKCRSGPGKVYDPITAILAGDQLTIEGQNQDGSWWLVHLPGDGLCWISKVTGHTTGNTGNVPVEAAPDTPTPEACYVYDPNQQLVCTSPCPDNAQPGGACTP